MGQLTSFVFYPRVSASSAFPLFVVSPDFSWAGQFVQMIVLIDNYDSFVYNLARYLTELGCETMVVRNDAVSVADVAGMSPQAIVISPGPCTPNESGISMELIRELGLRIPILGVCLGHQAMAAALGGRVIRAPEPVHGRTSSSDMTAAGCLPACRTRCAPRDITR